MLTGYPSTTPLGPRLRVRLTLRCLPWRRNPWVFGVKGFHFDSRVLIPASSLPNAPPLVSTVASLLMGTLPYPSYKVRRPSFGGPLNPDHSRREHAGLVSYYALFQGMAASKPTSQLSRHVHILRYT